VTKLRNKHNTAAAVSTAQSNISITLNRESTMTIYTWWLEELQNDQRPEKVKPRLTDDSRRSCKLHFLISADKSQVGSNINPPSNRPRAPPPTFASRKHKCPRSKHLPHLVSCFSPTLYLILPTMKPRLLLLFLAGTASVAAGPLPHFFVQNYTMHMALLDAYPMDHPIWMARMGDRELKVIHLIVAIIQKLIAKSDSWHLGS
jgi:hypothetical protein